MTIEDLLIIDDNEADAMYGSAFYYGNIPEKYWIQILANKLHQATIRGIKYASNNQRSLRDNY